MGPGVLVETLWAAGFPGFACIKSFQPVTPVNASTGSVTDQLCLLVWRCLSGAFQCFHNELL